MNFQPGIAWLFCYVNFVILVEARGYLWKIFDKIRLAGWIALTRFLFNRNIFPLKR